MTHHEGVRLAIAILTALAVAALLVAERLGDPGRGRANPPGGAAPRAGVTRWRFVTKGLASTGFIAMALACGALGSIYGRVVLGALALSWLGDLLLVPSGSGAVFKGGIFAFLLGHLAFIGAFFARGVSLAAAGLAAVVTVPAAIALGAFFVRRAAPELRAPVAAYAGVLSAMLTFAVGTHAAAPALAIVAGGAAFYASDLSVALDRLIAPSFVHRAWGLPLYYAAQLLFAWSVGGGR